MQELCHLDFSHAELLEQRHICMRTPTCRFLPLYLHQSGEFDLSSCKPTLIMYLTEMVRSDILPSADVHTV